MSSKKVIIVGNPESGKTKLASKLIGTFDPTKRSYEPTISVNIHSMVIDDVTYYLWDTAGSEMYEGIGPGYYVGADYAIIVTGGQSRKTQRQWTLEVRKVREDIPILVIGSSSVEKIRRFLTEN